MMDAATCRYQHCAVAGNARRTRVSGAGVCRKSATRCHAAGDGNEAPFHGITVDNTGVADIQFGFHSLPGRRDNADFQEDLPDNRAAAANHAGGKCGGKRMSARK